MTGASANLLVKGATPGGGITLTLDMYMLVPGKRESQSHKGKSGGKGKRERGAKESEGE